MTEERVVNALRGIIAKRATEEVIVKPVKKQNKPISFHVGGWASTALSWVWGHTVKLTLVLALASSALAAVCYGGHIVTERYTMPTIEFIGDYINELRGIKPAGSDIVAGKAPNFDVDWNNPCYAAAWYAAKKYDIPIEVLLTMIKHESNGDPRAVNKNKNGSTDRGCTQINGDAHKDAFANAQDVFLAPINVDYGARFLRKLFDETRNWERARVMYNSRNHEKQAVYRQGLNRAAKAIGATQIAGN